MADEVTINNAKRNLVTGFRGVLEVRPGDIEFDVGPAGKNSLWIKGAAEGLPPSVKSEIPDMLAIAVGRSLIMPDAQIRGIYVTGASVEDYANMEPTLLQGFLSSVHVPGR